MLYCPTSHHPRHGLVAVGADHPCFTEVSANLVSLEMLLVFKETGFPFFLELQLLLVDPFVFIFLKTVLRNPFTGGASFMVIVDEESEEKSEEEKEECVISQWYA
ncbi:hypothetical protein M413DRAFT_443872 [Hebeloma cylindrosporum]|uniref:Uncharacterized protein n=1 Tax=Hebeloma cylindrosporum TaxID=76867 RepID=A0A0C2XZN8_HEBCY|nr:hypothetical protein M413DRAFT_443872 [Hebeloma cylindrosporum h7]